MKKIVLTAIAVACVTSVYAQGWVNFNTKAVGNTAAGEVWAPIYLPQVGSETSQTFGRPAGVAVGGVTGNTAYTGGFVTGTGFSAELWGGAEGSAEGALVLVAKTTFRTQTTTAVGGTVTPPASSPAVPNVPAGQKATFQLRVYENKAGVDSWAKALAAAAADPTYRFGASKLFTPSVALGSATAQIPNLAGLESFSLQVVPEPSVIALGVLGVGALVLFRRRK